MAKPSAVAILMQPWPKAGETERKSVQAYLPWQSGLSDRDADLAKIQHH